MALAKRPGNASRASAPISATNCARARRTGARMASSTTARPVSGTTHGRAAVCITTSVPSSAASLRLAAPIVLMPAAAQGWRQHVPTARPFLLRTSMAALRMASPTTIVGERLDNSEMSWIEKRAEAVSLLQYIEINGIREAFPRWGQEQRSQELDRGQAVQIWSRSPTQRPEATCACQTRSQTVCTHRK